MDIALWDLCGIYLELPVYELMGGTDPVVSGYASGLAFAHDDETTRTIYADFAAGGFTTAKVKIGYPTLEEDLERLQLVESALGPDCQLAVDINGTRTPKRAIRRIRQLRAIVMDILWIEDPVPAANRARLKRVVDGLPQTLVNAGEYVDFNGKRDCSPRTPSTW